MTPDLRNYLIITFALCWTLAGAFAALGGEWGGPASVGVALLYMLIPGATAIVIDRRSGRRVRDSLRLRWRPNRWWLVAWLMFPLLVLAAAAASALLPQVTFDPSGQRFLAEYEEVLGQEAAAELRVQITALPVHFLWVGLAQGLLAGATINAAFALGEELGWRGLMLRELTQLGFWNSALVIGAVWGIWHAPLVLQGHNYPDYPLLGVVLMTAWCMLLAPLLSWVTLRADSTVAAAVAHGTLNGTAGLTLVLVAGGHVLVTGILGVVGFAVLLAANIVLFLAAKPSLTARH